MGVDAGSAAALTDVWRFPLCIGGTRIYPGARKPARAWYGNLHVHRCRASNFLGSALGGFVIEARGFHFLFLTYAAVPLLGIVILLLGNRRLKRSRTGAM